MADFFALHSINSINVLELLFPETIDALEFDQLNESIAGHLAKRAGERWIVDCHKIDYMGSAMLGLMVNLRQQIKTGGGRLVLSDMSPRLAEIFRACSMERLFTISKTRVDALQTLAK